MVSIFVREPSFLLEQYRVLKFKVFVIWHTIKKHWNKYPEHNTDSEDCWCEPRIEVQENGNKVVIHRDFSA
ncbi:MAG: hypothetical protein WA066_02930 [Candidatus Omnitrophota bacterium]